MYKDHHPLKELYSELNDKTSVIYYSISSNLVQCETLRRHMHIPSEKCIMRYGLKSGRLQKYFPVLSHKRHD